MAMQGVRRWWRRPPRRRPDLVGQGIRRRAPARRRLRLGAARAPRRGRSIARRRRRAPASLTRPSRRSCGVFRRPCVGTARPACRWVPWSPSRLRRSAPRPSLARPSTTSWRLSWSAPSTRPWTHRRHHGATRSGTRFTTRKRFWGRTSTWGRTTTMIGLTSSSMASRTGATSRSGRSRTTRRRTPTPSTAIRAASRGPSGRSVASTASPMTCRSVAPSASRAWSAGRWLGGCPARTPSTTPA
mmetsp:Transcript_42690/g.120628  ORF Transcript_42690/g.120628 Transcript_42690/m.120628 type:complete len:243 (+) Transcript_42690:101-829(+)